VVVAIQVFDAGSYRLPVFKVNRAGPPPQTIIRDPDQFAVW
jgi:hypothetical protein